MQIVDTHAHIYHPDEAAYPKKENPLRPPDGTGHIAHLKQMVRASGVERVVLVQTGSAYQWDNRLLGDTAAEQAEWTVGVCTLNPAAQESVTELERLSSDFNVKGLRMEPTKSNYPIFYHPGASRMWETALRLGVVICAHVQSRYLEQLADLLSRYPDVPVVLDHAAYPKAAEGVDSETVKAVVDLARFGNLHVKLTFTVTGSDAAYPFQDMHPIVRRMIEAYGPDRCMWGSDFPCELWLKKASYEQHLSIFTEELGLSEGEKQAILEETPMRLWFERG